MIKFLMFFMPSFKTLIEDYEALRRDNRALLGEFRNLKAQNQSLRVQLSNVVDVAKIDQFEEKRLKELSM